MRFTLQIELGDNAMHTQGHVATALSAVAAKVLHRFGTGERIGDFNTNTTGDIHTVNGDKVGDWQITN